MAATGQIIRNTAAGAALILALNGAVLAGPVAEKAAEAEAAMGSGDYLGGLAAAREITEQVWDATPGILFLETLPVTEAAAGFGLYNPRPDAVYKTGEPIILYAEPVGFGYGTGGEGLFNVGFAVDLQVLDEAGQELGNVENVTELNLTARYKLREFQANLTYNLEGIAPGKYRLVTTLRDKNSPKTGSFETVIEITG
ncbi:hypothetical protein MASR2M74_24810 [Paracoccaceae bacterium]